MEFEFNMIEADHLSKWLGGKEMIKKALWL